MRDLAAQTGVDVTDANYLNGKLVNSVTKAGEGINQDIVQVWQKLMSLAGLTANGNPDNEANGYQMITALASYLKSFRLLGTIENLDFNDQFTVAINTVSKTKVKEIIIASDGDDAAFDITLTAGNFEGEECVVIMSAPNSNLIRVRYSAATLAQLSSGSSAHTFIWTNANWSLKNKQPDASITDAGVQENADQTENDAGSLANRTVTPSVNARTLRYLPKTLADGEDYTVANGVGKIIIPSSVTEGTITLPSSSDTFTGQQIHILSTGGDSVWVYLSNGTTVIISDINLVASKLYILTWTGSTWWTTSAIDAPGTLLA